MILPTYLINAQQTTTTNNPTAIIENKDLLQADAAMIAGLLILFTVSSLKGLEFKFSLGSTLAIIPFMLSAVLIIYSSMGNYPSELTKWAKGWAIGGFVSMPLVLFILSKDIIAFYKRRRGERL